MTDKQQVIEAPNTLREHASLEEMIEESHIMVAARGGRADIAAGRAKTQ
jgi:hypothetical protein